MQKARSGNWRAAERVGRRQAAGPKTQNRRQLLRVGRGAQAGRVREAADAHQAERRQGNQHRGRVSQRALVRLDADQRQRDVRLQGLPAARVRYGFLRPRTARANVHEAKGEGAQRKSEVSVHQTDQIEA